MTKVYVVGGPNRKDDNTIGNREKKLGMDEKRDILAVVGLV